jgi:hypothetical protein
MIISRGKFSLVIFTVVFMAACSKRHNQFETMVPTEASSVSYVHQSDMSEGVTFQVHSEPRSYRYIQAVRKELRTSGYLLCEKSAISEWAPQPADPKSVDRGGYWIVELYATSDHEKFFVMRVMGTPTSDGTSWRQTFHLAAQTVPSGRQDEKSIKEFCD